MRKSRIEVRRLNHLLQTFKYEVKRHFILWSSAVFLIFFVFVGLFAYLIIPDNSQNANTQILSYSLLPKHSKRLVAYAGVEKKSGNMWIGYTYSGMVLPVSEYYQQSDKWIIQYAGKTDTLLNVHIKECYFRWGTDKYGRDVLSRMLLSARTSLLIGFLSMLIATTVGVVLGLYSGYYGGWIERFLLWFINVFWAIPSLLVIIGISFAMGKGFNTIFIALGLTLWVSTARAVRGQVLAIKELEFIQAARALAYPTYRILYWHILPNLWSVIIVYSTETFANAILMEAGLSFLGLGIQPPTPSWGNMLKEGVYYFTSREYAHLAWYPGVAIMMVVLCFNLLANGLRDRLDVKFKFY
ncbi:MAG: ABC transporter permease [Bacteroidia bacterium]|nr:ABC transporter permease [Bacteroidia bacterium]MDW8348125.1 ABC transporter permease [Bacteroidia bacterium]